jgi:poly(A) polymerase
LTADVGTDDAPARTPVLSDTSARIIPRDAHPISRSQISEGALKVLYRLIKAGHHAFLVGGGVRDLLLGQDPKDFDIATDALPEEVHELFRNSRLIGRRFRLAHVRFGREIIEVATFRGPAADAEPAMIEAHELPSRRKSGPDNEPAAALSGSGMILRDNVYGTVEQDAERRDFTINALYYTPADFCIYDFAGGLEDIEARRIRLIGDPEQRYREDPVRMLRALRFAAKLDFTLDPSTARPIRELGELLLDVPPARLFDEVVKLLLHGQGLRTFELLREHDLFRMLFPASEARIAHDPVALAVVRTALANTDQRIEEDRPVTPGFLIAALLWPALLDARDEALADGLPPAEALAEASRAVIARQQMHTSVPKRFSTFVCETWELQPRLERNAGRRAARLLSHPRFRAAYDFLVVRERAGDDTGGKGAWWTQYQASDEGERDALAAAATPEPGSEPRRRRRGGRRRRRTGSAAAE